MTLPPYPSRLVFTFGWEGDAAAPPGSSTIEVALTPDGDGTDGRRRQGEAKLEPIIARWSDWTGTGIEHLVLTPTTDVITADGVVISGGDGRFAARYRVVCDLGWRVRRAEVELIGDERRLQLSSDGQGHWLDGEANPLHDLNGAVDIDLSMTPFTNTLPIRRLDLAPGQSADIVAAYIRVPELTVTNDPQRYSCIERRARYRYESLDSDFVREIETDRDGVVVIYPGLFRRMY